MRSGDSNQRGTVDQTARQGDAWEKPKTWGAKTQKVTPVSRRVDLNGGESWTYFKERK